MLFCRRVEFGIEGGGVVIIGESILFRILIEVGIMVFCYSVVWDVRVIISVWWVYYY